MAFAKWRYCHLITDLPVKCASKPIKAGTKMKNIKLTSGDHNIYCKVEGFGAIALKSIFVRKGKALNAM